MLVLADPVALQTLRHQGFDQYQRWQPRVHEDVPVRVINIDEASLERIGQWPWPRDTLARLVQQLGAQAQMPNAIRAFGQMRGVESRRPDLGRRWQDIN